MLISVHVVFCRGYLERFEGFIQAKKIEEDDFRPYLEYWVKMSSGTDSKAPEVTKKVLPAFWKFVEYYRYRKVVDFVERYHKIREDLKPNIQEM